MGFRTLAIQKRSSEVWQLLAAVKTEFGKYDEILDKVQQKLHEASNTLDKVSVQRRAIDRKPRGVEILPEMEAGAILSLPGKTALMGTMRSMEIIRNISIAIHLKLGLKILC